MQGFHIVIVDPISDSTCRYGEVGEIWVANNYLRDSLPCTTSDSCAAGDNSFGMGMDFERTGDYGFLWPDQTYPEQDPYLYLLGSTTEGHTISGNLYFSSEIEECIEKCHRNVTKNGWFVFGP